MNNRIIGKNIQNERYLSISFLLSVCLLIALYDFNIATLFVIGWSIFFVSNFGVFEYIAISLILLVKSQSDVVLASSDLFGYTEIYNLIGRGYDPYGEDIFSPGEVILPTLFWILSRLFPVADIHYLAFIFILVFLFFFYPIVNMFKSKAIVAISLLLFVDVNLIVHLFRQSISSLILLLSVVYIQKEYLKNKMKSFILYIIAGFTHTTSFIFGLMTILFVKMHTKYLKIFLIVSFIIGLIYLPKDSFVDLLIISHGVPIVGKASYALNVFESESGIRILAMISAIAALFVKSDNNLFKIYLGFMILALLFYQVPIIAPRIGLIGTSILTGLPIGLLLHQLRQKLSNYLKRRYADD